MKHLKDITKKAENSFRRSGLGDAMIQMYRSLKYIGPEGNSGVMFYRGVAHRIYPPGTCPTNFIEPPEERRVWK